jgi:hypothetical protein
MDNRLRALIGLVLVGAIGYYAFFYKKCEPPTETQMQTAALTCIMKLSSDPQALRAGICKDLGREAGCELQEEDKPKAQGYLNKVLTTCMEKDLAADNLCTDKVKGLLE